MESRVDENREILIFADLETAGLSLSRPILQIAAVAVSSRLEELESIEFKIQFDEADAEPRALLTNHYSPERWRNEAIEPTYAATQFAGFLKRYATVDLFSSGGRRYQVAQLVAHNGERFDGPFLQAWYRRLGLFCPARYMVLCTKQRALWLFEEDKTLTPPSDFKLGTLCQYFGVALPPAEAHDALNEVRATVELYRAMREHEQRRGSALQAA